MIFVFVQLRAAFFKTKLGSAAAAAANVGSY